MITFIINVFDNREKKLCITLSDTWDSTDDFFFRQQKLYMEILNPIRIHDWQILVLFLRRNFLLLTYHQDTRNLLKRNKKQQNYRQTNGCHTKEMCGLTIQVQNDLDLQVFLYLRLIDLMECCSFIYSTVWFQKWWANACIYVKSCLVRECQIVIVFSLEQGSYHLILKKPGGGARMKNVFSTFCLVIISILRIIFYSNRS